jgi:hypothetical protein
MFVNPSKVRVATRYVYARRALHSHPLRREKCIDPYINVPLPVKSPVVEMVSEGRIGSHRCKLMLQSNNG